MRFGWIWRLQLSNSWHTTERPDRTRMQKPAWLYPKSIKNSKGSTLNPMIAGLSWSILFHQLGSVPEGPMCPYHETLWQFLSGSHHISALGHCLIHMIQQDDSSPLCQCGEICCPSWHLVAVDMAGYPLVLWSAIEKWCGLSGSKIHHSPFADGLSGYLIIISYHILSVLDGWSMLKPCKSLAPY